MASYQAALEKFVLPGYVPKRPLLSRDQIVLTQGSCFADEIAAALKRQDINTASMSLGEEINTPASMRLMFDYAFNGVDYANDEHERYFASGIPGLRTTVPRMALAIFTLGVAFYPYRNEVLTHDLDPRRLDGVYWKLSTPEENVGHIQHVAATIRRLNPAALIVLTVSPIPLKNSFLLPSPMVADCISKSTLRVAADYLTRDGSIRYWPAFEAFRWLGAHFGQIYGAGEYDHLHVEKEKIDIITREFIKAYFG